ncbi:MAG: hypothetical protein M3Y59_21960 [Myxococcota bacterium]|nr:hypothetical protein [Myxococcota bacterium]
MGLLLGAVLSATAFAAPEEAVSEGITLSNNSEQRKASLLTGLELDSSYKPSAHAALGLMDGLRFDLQDKFPLETGAGLDSGMRPVLALLLGLLVGFGLGHLVARDRDGFILFLIVDVVIVVLASVIHVAVFSGGGWFWGIGGLAKLVSQIIQGIDAYAQAGGGRLVQWSREHTIQIATSESIRDTPAATFRTFGFQF